MSLPPDEYYYGLFDSLGRVRFDFSYDEPQESYSVRPELRLRTRNDQLTTAIIGEKLEAMGIDYEYVERDRGEDFFYLFLRKDLKTFHRYLKGQSTQLIRELTFTLGPFQEFDYEIMEPARAYELSQAVDELYYDWNPRGNHFTEEHDIESRHDIDSATNADIDIPPGKMRSEYSIEYISGIFDGLAVYRCSIAKQPTSDIGFSMYPVANLYRNGVHPAFSTCFKRFASQRELEYSDMGEYSTLRIAFDGTSDIRQIASLLGANLWIQYEATEQLMEEILPKFDQGKHKTKEGFLDLMTDFESLPGPKGRMRERKYTVEFFQNKWEIG